jgi:hypothetical protein
MGKRREPWNGGIVGTAGTGRQGDLEKWRKVVFLAKNCLFARRGAFPMRKGTRPACHGTHPKRYGTRPVAHGMNPKWYGMRPARHGMESQTTWDASRAARDESQTVWDASRGAWDESQMVWDAPRGAWDWRSGAEKPSPARRDASRGIWDSSHAALEKPREVWDASDAARGKPLGDGRSRATHPARTPWRIRFGVRTGGCVRQNLRAAARMSGIAVRRGVRA